MYLIVSIALKCILNKNFLIIFGFKVFPRSVLQAWTEFAVWCRFHEVKRLHCGLKRRHKQLQLSGYLPEPIHSSFVKRIVKYSTQKCKKYILQLLDYAGHYPALYKFHKFAQFFNKTTPLIKYKQWYIKPREV